MANLIAPTLDLFVYDIRKEFGQTLEDLQSNREHFRQKLPATYDDSSWQHDLSFEGDFVELLSDKTEINSLSFVAGDYQGYYYPVRLQDVYGVLISCSARDKSFPYPVLWLQEAKAILEEKVTHETVTLGQTWMISAQLDKQTSTHNDPELLAQECYLSLFPQYDWQTNLKSVNTFLGGTFFELWQYKCDLPENLEEVNLENYSIRDFEENHHLIIAIYPDREIASAATYFLDDWLRLWCYHHKILASYSQSRFLKQILENDVIEIQQYLEKFKKEFDRVYNFAQLDLEWQHLEDIYAHYVLDLYDFKNQVCKIQESCENYVQQLEGLEEVLKIERLTADLYGFKQFIPKTTQPYLGQIERDWERLKEGEKLLEASLDLLRTEIEIYQVRNERDFQHKAIATGIGLSCGVAMGAIAYRVITVETPSVDETTEIPTPQAGIQTLLTPDVWAIPGIVMIIGVCAAIVTGGMTRLWLFWSDRVLGSR